MAEARSPLSLRTVINEIVRRLNEDVRRMRDAEMRLDRMDATISDMQESMISKLNDLENDLTKLGSKIDMVAGRLTNMENEILRINKVLSRNATKAELKSIETYVEILNPITSKFVTREEMERILNERLKKKS